MKPIRHTIFLPHFSKTILTKGARTRHEISGALNNNFKVIILTPI